MNESEKKIVEFLKNQAEKAWEKNEPYLLSLAGSDLENNKIEYRTILSGERLKAFAERTQGEDTYKIVRHPHQKARIGILKYDAEFEFDISDQKLLSNKTLKNANENRNLLLLDFLDAISKLPDTDIDSIVLPTRVLLKLAGKR